MSVSEFRADLRGKVGLLHEKKQEEEKAIQKAELATPCRIGSAVFLS